MSIELQRFLVVLSVAVICLSFKVPVLVFGIGVSIVGMYIFIKEISK